MRHTIVCLIALGVAGAVHAAGQEAGALSAVQEPNQVVVKLGDDVLAVYKTASDQKYPYFFPVNGPVSGESVTTETSEPYPHHHSLFFGCDRVNDGNYWQEGLDRGQIVSQKTTIETNGPDKVVFTDTCLWQKPGEEPIISDDRRFTITAPSATTRFIDAEFTLTPIVDVHIGKTNHSLFSARMVPELSVKSGGTLVNAEGNSSEAGTAGVKSPWCDYFGTRDGATEGLAILQSPSNRWYPSQWFTRDYGFFSPTPMFWLGDDGLDLPKGEPLVLRYRVVVHAGTTEEAGIAEVFKAYSQEAGA